MASKAARCVSAGRFMLVFGLLGAVMVMTSSPVRTEAVHAQPGQSQVISAMLKRFQSLKTLSCSFEETKHIALLSTPLVSTGEIHYHRDWGLLRSVDAPVASSALLKGDALYLLEGAPGEGRSAKTIDLSTNPMLRAFVDSFRALLAGDEASLRRHYRLSLTQGEGRFALEMTPLDARVQKLMKALVVEGKVAAGHRQDIEKMTLQETSGDRSVTVLKAVRANAAGAETALRPRFAIPGVPGTRR